MVRVTAGTAIVDTLRCNGVDTVFGLPGVQTYALFDALYEARDQIRTIGARHEQGLAYMAFGYARSTDRLGVFSPVPGPGILNSGAALATALATCSPVLCLTGDIPTEYKGQGRGHLHELPDQLATLRGMTKWAAHIHHPAAAPARVSEGIGQALSGRRGPAALEICWDTLAQTYPAAPAESAEISPATAADPDMAAQAAKLLRDAKAPMIFVGTGARDAGDAVAELAEVLDAPVVAFRGGRGIVPEDAPRGLTMAAAYNLWPETDVMIGIGTRLEIPFLRWGNPHRYDRRLPGKTLVRIDIDPQEMTRLETAAPIVADAAEGTRALLAALRREGVTLSGRSAAIAEAKAKAKKDTQEIQPHIAYLDVIRSVLPRDGFLVEELCQVGYAAYYGFPVYEPRTYVNCGYQGTLGYGFPTALGVKVANPDKPVISIAGDGGFMFGVQELATAVQYGIPVVALVFNNNAYGNVRRDQQTLLGGHVIGTDLVNPDFVKMAESFGAAGFRVESPEGLKPVLEKALGLDAPVLIEIETADLAAPSPWKYIHPSA